MVDNVNGVAGTAGELSAPRRGKRIYHFAETPSPADSVEFSSEVMRLSGVKGVRLDRVMEIRSKIAAGDYFTPDKLDFALDRALDEVLSGLPARE
ncbi:MAG: flagellar biosynthesis anti-sigma factor FlgM [Planctomycetota bacterium]|jgi:hypothetical protein|nr:flagellar biosynthesis anti-sigma factor FlgM [Planctomycetota bacterium]